MPGSAMLHAKEDCLVFRITQDDAKVTDYTERYNTNNCVFAPLLGKTS